MIDASSSSLITGMRFGRYVIRGVLGRGGMGEVYVAFDTKLERLVALKILLATHVQDASYLMRFKREALSASALNHPHILTVYDIGISNGRHFISMELVEGMTVRQRLLQKPFNTSEALDIAIQVSDALVAAHRANIVHRDIKPENIMLRDASYAKLLDFGLAKTTDSRKSQTETAPGTIVGTPQYMSPEQALGDTVDVRTDIWSLGVVLYEMLTGNPPFAGSNVTEMLRAVITDSPTPLPRYIKELKPELESLIRRALAKKADERHQSAAELLASLKSIRRSIKPGGDPYPNEEIDSEAPSVGLSTVKIVSEDPLSGPRQRHRRKGIRSLAILPFVNADPRIKSDYLSDGLTETIINTLSQLPQLRVMARSSVFRFKDRQENPRAVGNELGVAAVLTGRLQRVGSKYVVQTELVDVADGSQLWGAQFNRKTGDVLQIQEEIARDISEKLKLNLSSRQRKRLSKRPTVDENAYHSYLRGRFNWNKRSTEGLRQSIDFFNEAIEIDPLFALAYAGIADAYAVLGNQHSMVLTEAYTKAKAAAVKALAIDDTLAEAYPTLGYIRGAYDRDWIGSEQAFKKAIDLNPGYATAHQWYSAILRALGRVDEALEEARTAFSLDPLSTIINANVGLSLYVARRYDEAADLFRRSLTIEPKFFWTHYLLGLTQRQQNEHASALKELQLALSLANDKQTEAVVISDLAYTFGILGQKEEANRLIGELETLRKVSHVSPYDLAVAYLGVGEKDTAFHWLDEAYRTRDEGLLWLKVDPVLDEVRSDLRYLTLLKQVGLT